MSKGIFIYFKCNLFALKRENTLVLYVNNSSCLPNISIDIIAIQILILLVKKRLTAVINII